MRLHVHSMPLWNSSIKFHYRPYGSVLDPTYQIEGEGPIMEVKSIKDKRGEGNKVQHLASWAGVNPKTGAPHSDSLEPAKYLKLDLQKPRYNPEPTSNIYQTKPKNPKNEKSEKSENLK